MISIIKTPRNIHIMLYEPCTYSKNVLYNLKIYSTFSILNMFVYLIFWTKDISMFNMISTTPVYPTQLLQ